MRSHWKAVLARRLLNEDDQVTAAQANPGAAVEALRCVESQLGFDLPRGFRDFYLVTNGCEFFGLHLLETTQWETWPDSTLLGFHAWGNGDFDAIDLQTGAVVFVNHRPEAASVVAVSFEEWMEQIIAELSERGTVYHPSDYCMHPNAAGLHAHCFVDLEQRGFPFAD